MASDGRASTPLLEVRDLTLTYGGIVGVSGFSMTVPAGDVVALLGPNGAGKTTTLAVCSGQIVPSAGQVLIYGREINGTGPDALARAGVCLVPEGRGIFPNLTVTENLRMYSHAGASFAEIQERAFAQFPRLQERRKQVAGTLSGGEQQMLAIARVLRTGARLLLCDEPTEGLSPLLVRQIGDILRSVKAHGVTVLLIEQNLHFATTVADRHYLLAEGRVAESLDNADVARREHELLSYLGM